LISSSTLRLVDFAAVARFLTPAERLLAFAATNFRGDFLVAVVDVARVLFEVFFLAFAPAFAFAIASDIAERFRDERPFIPHLLRLDQECFLHCARLVINLEILADFVRWLSFIRKPSSGLFVR
jgi:hypothetical protein